MIWITTSQDHSRPAAASMTPERIGGFAFFRAVQRRPNVSLWFAYRLDPLPESPERIQCRRASCKTYRSGLFVAQKWAGFPIVP